MLDWILSVMNRRAVLAAIASSVVLNADDPEPNCSVDCGPASARNAVAVWISEHSAIVGGASGLILLAVGRLAVKRKSLAFNRRRVN